jgi:predicted amidohydrolase
METISERLEQAESVFELATGLGQSCLGRGKQMLEILADKNADREMTRLERLVGETDLELWEDAVRRNSLDGLASSALIAQAARLRADHPLDFLAILRGLCRRALPQLYVETEGQIALDRGSPVRFAARPVQQIFDAATPHQETLQNGHLLEGLGFSLFGQAAGGGIEVTLDFAHRDRIDALGWIEGEQPRLPRIATIHPYGDGAYTYKDYGDGFFGVGPNLWDEEHVLKLLAKAGTSESSAEIALLAELSLPDPGALEAPLAAEPRSYPPLVIAGSAHATLADGTRVNEARIYLDGLEVGRHRKIHPFYAKVEGREEKVREAISRVPARVTLLSGSHTRVAVVICADLDDAQIPALLADAGANLLLVPSFSEEPGAFNGAICNLASRCQGVTVIANSQLGSGSERRFRVAAAVPREALGDQSKEYGPDRDRPVAEAALLDPNLKLSEALMWS